MERTMTKMIDDFVKSIEEDIASATSEGRVQRQQQQRDRYVLEIEKIDKKIELEKKKAAKLNAALDKKKAATPNSETPLNPRKKMRTRFASTPYFC